jgi:hypothetical protein
LDALFDRVCKVLSSARDATLMRWSEGAEWEASDPHHHQVYFDPWVDLFVFRWVASSP